MGGEGSAARRGWYFGWNIVAACILSRVSANGLTSSTLTLFLRDWSAELHVPISRLQLPAAALIIVSALIAPLVGQLADRRPARLLIGGGLVGMAAFFLAVSWTHAAWQIVLLFGLLAPVALTLSTGITCSALISRWFTRRAGFALGLCASGTTLGGVFLPPLVAWLLPLEGWRVIWRGAAVVVALVIAPLLFVVARDRPTERDGLDEVGTAPQARPGEAGGAPSWGQIAGRPRFWVLVGAYLPMLALYMGCAQNLAPYVAAHGLSRTSAGLLVSVISVSQIVGTSALGALADRVGVRGPFAGLAGIMILGAVILSLPANGPLIPLGIALVGLGGGVLGLLSAALAKEFGAAAMGRALGLCMFFLPLGAFAPFVIARAQEATGSYAPGLLGMAALVAGSGALSLLLSPRPAPLTGQAPGIR
jgi:MFS family permease